MLLFAAIPHAQAIEVHGGVQATLYPEGIEQLRGVLEERVFSLDGGEHAVASGCYDAVGIRDLNLEVPVESVEVETYAGYLDLTLNLGTVVSQDFDVYGEDADWLDSCVSFETHIDRIVLRDARLTATMGVEVVGGRLNLWLVETPLLVGDLESDIDWFPDTLALGLFEDTLFALANEMIANELPRGIASLAESALGEGQYKDYEAALTMTKASVGSSGIDLAASADILFTGTGACPRTPASIASTGRNPELVFTDPEESGFAFGVTESLLTTVLLAAWESGAFCLSAEEGSELVESLRSSFDPEVAFLSVGGWLAEPPMITIEQDGIYLTIRGLNLSVEGTTEDDVNELLSVDADVRALVDVAVDQTLTAFTLSVHDVSLDIRELEARHLLSNREDAGEHLVDFLETWGTSWIAPKVQDVALFSSIYHLWDMALRLDSVAFEPGGVKVYASVFAMDDPTVDTQAPDTRVAAQPTDKGAILTWQGVDDRDQDLAYSYRLDNGPWSAWTTDTNLVVQDLLDGTHEIDVQARDGWMNVDTTPASTTFEVGPLADEGGCGCASGSNMGWSVWIVGLLGFARRRQNP